MPDKKLYNENTRVQVPAALHLVKLGYQYLDCIDGNVYDHSSNILTPILKHQLIKLNPGRSERELKQEIDKLIMSLQNNDLGREFYSTLTATSGIKFIDFDNPNNNTWHVTTEFTCENEKTKDNFRPDITLFVNGLPLVFIEVKKPQNKDGILAEQNRIVDRMRNKAFKSFFNATQFMIFSNNEEYDDTQQTHISGAFYATTSSGEAFFNLFREEDKSLIDHCGYKNTITEDEEFQVLKHRNCPQLRALPEYKTNCNPNTPTNRILTSMVSRERLLFILKYGIVYVDNRKENAKGEEITVLEKHIMRYQQLFATFAIRRKLDEGQNGGIIWHTQGSGKTALAYYNIKSLTDYFAAKNTPVKFYFIVDRLDLLEQAAGEFAMRGMLVREAQDRKTLMEDFNSYSVRENDKGKTEIMVANIQKFETDHTKVVIDNPYNTNLKRIIFIDEAHRGYDPKGSFLANLLEADPDAVRIALTGTPLLKDERASWRVFGNYIHTYYYDKSINDGYTLKLMREDIETRYKEELSEIIDKLMGDVQVKKSDIVSEEVIEHENYLRPVLRYIVRDLIKSRIQHASPVMGGMIVCQTNQQARNIYRIICEKWENISEPTDKRLNAELILHDEGDKEERKGKIKDFKKKEGIDILIVNAMLLTGFDAPRLKKLYLLKKLQEHTLLQALTRVNRRYKDFRYGYVVDFADIKENFIEANNRYLKELNDTTSEIPEEEFKKPGEVLMMSPKEVEIAMEELQDKLFHFSLDNVELFRQEVEAIDDKEHLYVIRHSLEEARALTNQVRSFATPEFKQTFDELKIDSLSSLISEVNGRINRINLLNDKDHKADVSGIIREALSMMEFELRKIGEEELRIEFNDLRDKYESVEREFAANIDKGEDKYISLSEDFKNYFAKRGFTPGSVAEAKDEIGYMEEVLKKIKEINRLNRALQTKYRDDEKFVRIHKRLNEKNEQNKDKPIISKTDYDIMLLLNRIKNEIDSALWNNKNLMDNEGFFSQLIMQTLSETMIDKQIRVERNDREWLRDKIAAEYLDSYQYIR